MDNNTSTGIKQIIQSLCPEGPSVIEGRVTGTSPLQIILSNDSRMILGENSLVIPAHMKNHTVAISNTFSSDRENIENIIVMNALQQGEKVYLLAYNNGKKYYILGRG